MVSLEAEDNQRQQSPPSDWEKAWFAYHFGSSLFAGIVGCLGFFDHPPATDAVASVDDAATAITQAATDILDDIPATLNSALSVLSRMTSPEKPSSPPMFGLLSSSTTTSTSGAPSRSPLGSLNRRDNIVSIANLFALAFFQNHEVSDHATPHFAVANDALVLFCSYHGLKVNSAAERRLMHKTLGLVKATQFLICMVDDRINHSYLAPNLFGLSLCLGATFRWGVSSKAKTRMLNSIKNILFLGNASSSSTSTTGGKGRKRGRLASKSKTMDVVEQQPSIVNEASESSTLGTPSLATTSTTAGKLDPYNRRIPSPAPSDSTLTELPVSAKVEVDIESFLKPDDTLNKDDTLPPLLDMNNEWRS
ncbi:hypothetical protein BDR26DRAFT_881128 [Obelidium mucronatum]|nr:hypothetical protein BDR26DRAFT_881128 [Obelidium mucronatum]